MAEARFQASLFEGTMMAEGATDKAAMWKVILTVSGIALALWLLFVIASYKLHKDHLESEAFCNELRAGRSTVEIYQGLRDQYDDSPTNFAGRAHWMASRSCPEQLKENDSLREFLRDWKTRPEPS